MIRFYYYKHPKTGKIYSEQRMKGFEKVPYKKDGVECELLPDYIPPQKEHKNLGVIQIFKNGQRNIWEADSQYLRKCNPKYVVTKEGRKVRYDPGKHC